MDSPVPLFPSKPVMEILQAWYIDRGEELRDDGGLEIDYVDERTLQSVQYRLLGNTKLVFPTQGLHAVLANGLVLVPFGEGEPLEQHVCWKDEGPGAEATRVFVEYLVDQYNRHAGLFPNITQSALAALEW